jgi:DNA-directed RNA polymerase specialized sigma24 family protein
MNVNGRRMLDAIDGLPSDEREVFDLIRIQGITQTEAADVLGVSVMTVKRRLKRGLLILTDAVGDLRPCEQSATASTNCGVLLPDGGGS